MSLGVVTVGVMDRVASCQTDGTWKTTEGMSPVTAGTS
jgi:hypothetical protein